MGGEACTAPRRPTREGALRPRPCRVASRVGVSPRTITTWQGLGLPIAGQSPGHGHALLFDPEDVRRWLGDNVSERALWLVADFLEGAEARAPAASWSSTRRDRA